MLTRKRSGLYRSGRRLPPDAAVESGHGERRPTYGVSNLSTELFDTDAAYAAALLRVIEASETELLCFDTDLARSGLERPGSIAVLKAWLVGDRRRRLRCVLHDCGYLARACPRLLALYRTRSSQFALRTSADNHRSFQQVFMIGDARHLATRFHADHSRGKLVIDDTRSTTWFTAQFETLLEASEPPSGIDILGV